MYLRAPSSRPAVAPTPPGPTTEGEAPCDLNLYRPGLAYHVNDHLYASRVSILKGMKSHTPYKCIC